MRGCGFRVLRLCGYRRYQLFSFVSLFLRLFVGRFVYYSFGIACAVSTLEGNCGGELQCFLFSIDYTLDSRVSYDQSDL